MGQHADAGVGGLEALDNCHAGFRLQEQAEQEAPPHHRADDPDQPIAVQVEAVAVEHNSNDRAEHDQRDQPGEDGVQQDLFHVEAPGRCGRL
ncbi:hypothetical protein D3C76_1224670 [compost metagenome]